MISNRKRAKQRYNSLLQALAHVSHTSDDDLVRVLLQIPIFQGQLNCLLQKEYKTGVADGLNMVMHHLETVSDLASGSIMQQAAYTRYTRLITHTSTANHPAEECGDNENDLRTRVEITKKNISKYRHGSEVKTQVSAKIDKLLKNEELLHKIVELVDSMGGYATVVKSKNGKVVAMTIRDWCLSNESKIVQEFAELFSTTNASKMIRDIFIFQTTRIATVKVRYRSKLATLIDPRGNSHKMFRLRSGNAVRAEGHYLVGQEVEEQNPSFMKKSEDGEWYLHWDEGKRIDIFTLALDRRYTYIGNIVKRKEVSGTVRVRHLDPRVLLLMRIFRIYIMDGFVETEGLQEKVIDLVSWVDGSNMDKSGRTDYCIQIVPDETIMDTNNEKQLSCIRYPMSTCITWETESSEVVSTLCAITSEDMVNMISFDFKHPHGYIVRFCNRYFVADNNAANAALGKQYGGKVRCKHCSLNFSIEEDVLDYCRCRSIAQQPITMQMIWERAVKHKKNVIQKEPNGLKRISGYFIDSCSDRSKYSVPDEHTALFTRCTEDYLRSTVPFEKLSEIQDAYDLYSMEENRITNVHFHGQVLDCTIKVKNTTSTIKLSLCSLQEQLTTDDESRVSLLFVMIYLHFNRLHSEIRLSDFGLEHLCVISDAPHNLAGFDDRLITLLQSETDCDSVQLTDRYTTIIGTKRSNSLTDTIDKGQIDNSQYAVDNCAQQGGHSATVCEGNVTRVEQNIMEQRDQMDQSQEGNKNSDESADVNTTDPKGESAIVQTCIDNLKWITLFQILLIRQCSTSERRINREVETFIFHWSSLLLYLLSIERYGIDIVQLFARYCRSYARLVRKSLVLHDKWRSVCAVLRRMEALYEDFMSSQA